MDLNEAVTAGTWLEGAERKFLARIGAGPKGWRVYWSKTGDVRAPFDQHGYGPPHTVPTFEAAVLATQQMAADRAEGAVEYASWPIREWDERAQGHADFRDPAVKLYLGVGQEVLDRLLMRDKTVERFPREERSKAIARYVDEVKGEKESE